MNYSHQLSQNKEIIKKGVPQTAKISQLEKFPQNLQASWDLLGKDFCKEQLVRYSSGVRPSVCLPACPSYFFVHAIRFERKVVLGSELKQKF